MTRVGEVAPRRRRPLVGLLGRASSAKAWSDAIPWPARHEHHQITRELHCYGRYFYVVFAHTMSWLLIVTTLPTENATARVRAWRALKVSGAAVLRDGGVSAARIRISG